MSSTGEGVVTLMIGAAAILGHHWCPLHQKEKHGQEYYLWERQSALRLQEL